MSYPFWKANETEREKAYCGHELADEMYLWYILLFARVSTSHRIQSSRSVFDCYHVPFDDIS